MEETEFFQLLERYPVVRKATYCRVQWNDSKTEEPIIECGSSGIYMPIDDEKNGIQSTDSMEEGMEKFLAPYFSSQETAKIQQELEKIQSDFIANLCLEDVNDLCAQFLNNTK